jgi:hypothetical protein
MENWDEIAARIELCLVIGDDGRPTEADLNAYEAAAGFRLPLDYRRFALAYGRGLMGGWEYEFRFDTPRSTAEGRGKRWIDSSLPEFEHVADDTGQRRRMVLFSNVCDYGDVFAWYPAEVTDPINHEMAIYLIGGRGHMDLFRRAGSTFLEVLVNEILRGPHDREIPGDGLGDLEPLGERYYFNHLPD